MADNKGKCAFYGDKGDKVRWNSLRVYHFYYNNIM